MYVLSLLLGVKLNWNPLALLGMLVTIVLAAVIFSTFSLIVACIVKTRERFMGIGQVLTMPLFFASNAIYPTSIMPTSLPAISFLNPLTYVVDALRYLYAGRQHQQHWTRQRFRGYFTYDRGPGDHWREDLSSHWDLIQVFMNLGNSAALPYDQRREGF